MKSLETKKVESLDWYEERFGKYYSIKSSPIFDENGEIIKFVDLRRDITERKRAEESLRKSEEKYRDLAELLPEVIFETDLEGNITYANQIAFDSFGYTQSDFDKGLNAFQMLIPEDRDRSKDNIQRVLSGETSGSREYTAQRKDKTTFHTLINSSPIIHENKPVGLRGVITDITERKRAENELKKKNEELELFNRLTVGRELKMIELKNEINALLLQLGKGSKYEIAEKS
jgi:PAS domain S-box-containing protein